MTVLLSAGRAGGVATEVAVLETVAPPVFAPEDAGAVVFVVVAGLVAVAGAVAAGLGAAGAPAVGFESTGGADLAGVELAAVAVRDAAEAAAAPLPVVLDPCVAFEFETPADLA